MNRFINNPHLVFAIAVLLTSMMVIVVGRAPLTEQHQDLIA